MDEHMAEQKTVNRKCASGRWCRTSNDKTIVVSVQRASRHRIYHKVIRRTKKYHAHDEANEATVRVTWCASRKPARTARLKRWRLVEILTEREVAEVAPEAIDQELVEEVQRSRRAKTPRRPTLRLRRPRRRRG
jgi:small subunit ribosomal protein S17